MRKAPVSNPKRSYMYIKMTSKISRIRVGSRPGSDHISQTSSSLGSLCQLSTGYKRHSVITGFSSQHLESAGTLSFKRCSDYLLLVSSLGACPPVTSSCYNVYNCPSTVSLPASCLKGSKRSCRDFIGEQLPPITILFCNFSVESGSSEFTSAAMKERKCDSKSVAVTDAMTDHVHRDRVTVDLKSATVRVPTRPLSNTSKRWHRISTVVDDRSVSKDSKSCLLCQHPRS